MIHDENNVVTDNELVIVKDLLKMSRHAYLCIWNEHTKDTKTCMSCWMIIYKWVYRLT